MSKVTNVKLNNGHSMPILGFGTWKSDPGVVTTAVKTAISCGYRHIDCALIYGNEREIGIAIKEKIEDGTVKREDLFVTSKLWNTFHSKEEAKLTIQTSLKDLGLKYLDLYLIHWPMGYQEKGEMFPKDGDKTLYSDVDYLETWKAMEDMVDEGLTKSIGVANFNSEQIKRILNIARIKPANVQVECHPYLNQEKLIDFCTKNEIKFTAYSPLGSPARPWAKAGDLTLLDNPTITEIAEAHKKSPAQVLIRYQIQRGVICIPKSVTESRIRSNFDVMDFELSTEEMAKINSMNKNHHFVGLEWIGDHPLFPFNIEY